MSHTQRAITVYCTKDEKQLIENMSAYYGKKSVSKFMLDLALSKAKIYERRKNKWKNMKL